MCCCRLAAGLLAVAAAAAVPLLMTRAGQGPAGVAPRPAAALTNNEVIQEFPVGGPVQTAWKVRYVAGTPGPGFGISAAWFKTSPEARWMKVLDSVRLSEIFVPYNNGTRIYDIGAQGNYKPLTHTPADAGPMGRLLSGGLVVQELRDAGILWKYYKQVRRAQDLVLWSTLGAGNYNYMMEYSFRGDGSITARLGSTGKNFGNHETTGHMHHGCWRIDVDLDEPDHNSVFVVKRREPVVYQGKATAEDVIEPFNGGIEGGVAWNAEEFTRLRVECRAKNGQGKTVCYELLPLRPGTARHWGKGEEFTHKDFWVTPHRWNEQYYRNLPKIVSQRRLIRDTNVVLWYLSPAYHLPRDEDGVFVNPETGRAQVRGVAMTTWCGFELRPRNLFEKSPLYP
jgi:hypothetical protein